MANPYFRNLPKFDYVSRGIEKKSISDYTEIKNLFKRAKLREDIFSNLNFFTKYSIIGDERPDNVAYKFYNDSTLDWIVLLSNNIVNIQTEWPIPQTSFDEILMEKYKTVENLNSIKHYETLEVKTLSGITIVPQGLIVPQDFSISYFEPNTGEETLVSSVNATTPVTNYEYETRIDNEKRNIFVLKKRYIPVVLNDLEDIMKYKKGSTQYISTTLKRGDNIRLYE